MAITNAVLPLRKGITSYFETASCVQLNVQLNSSSQSCCTLQFPISPPPPRPELSAVPFDFQLFLLFSFLPQIIETKSFMHNISLQSTPLRAPATTSPTPAGTTCPRSWWDTSWPSPNTAGKMLLTTLRIILVYAKA